MEKIKEVLFKQVLLIKPDKELGSINQTTNQFCKELEKKLKNKKIKADVFVGGSLAKDTIIKKRKHDIDIFVRFDKSYKDDKISKLLGRAVKAMKARKIHGSRDYFQVSKGKLIFEIIPTARIARPEQARNVTDLSYFHVNYIKGKIRKKKTLAEDIRLAKSFAYAQDCYGAESYIKGFSGYALELLVSYYGSFLRFIKAIKESKEKRIILDPGKFYKNKQEILLELNEAKLQSPIVFVDPTFKERNALAALSRETLNKFKAACAAFLNKPNSKFFEKKDIEQELKRKYKNLIIIEVKTNRQAGDIAGSKLKRFYEFLTRKAEKYFDIKIREFEYNEGKNIGKIYLVLRKKEKIIIQGPPVTAVEHLTRFKKKHKNCYIKKGKAYAKEKSMSLKEFLQDLKKDKAVREMGITKIN